MRELCPYEKLLQRHQNVIWSLCYRYARQDETRCKDLMQEVSIALWQHFGSLRPGTPLLVERAWVIWKTRTVLFDLHRKPTPQLVFGLDLDSFRAEDGQEKKSNDETLEDFLATLDEKNRQIIELRLQGYSPGEIADRMGLKRDTVYKRIQRIVTLIEKKNSYGKE